MKMLHPTNHKPPKNVGTSNKSISASVSWHPSLFPSLKLSQTGRKCELHYSSPSPWSTPISFNTLNTFISILSYCRLAFVFCNSFNLVCWSANVRRAFLSLFTMQSWKFWRERGLQLDHDGRVSNLWHILFGSNNQPLTLLVGSNCVLQCFPCPLVWLVPHIPLFWVCCDDDDLFQCWNCHSNRFFPRCVYFSVIIN